MLNDPITFHFFMSDDELRDERDRLKQQLVQAAGEILKELSLVNLRT